MRTVIPSTPRGGRVVPSELPPVATLDEWGQNPSASTNPRDGHFVTSVYHYGDDLLTGYGDWTANTGPIDLVALALTDASPRTLFPGVRTECIEVFREFEGALYAPWIDNRAGTTTGIGGYLTDAGGTWHEVETTGVDYVHMFDIATLDGSDIIVSGAARSTGTIHRTTDGGATWTDITPAGVVDIRLYNIFAANGVLYQPNEHKRWTPADGWTAWPLNGWANTIMANRPALGGWIFNRGVALEVATGATVEHNYSVRPECTDGQYVYGSHWSGGEGHSLVLRTPGVVDGRVEWEPVLRLPTANLTPNRIVSGTSLAVISGYVYVGGSQGRVFRTPLPN